MYYIANFSVVSMDRAPVGSDNFPELTDSETLVDKITECKETVFCQADLWNLHKHSRTIYVTDRLPRTWEGLW